MEKGGLIVSIDFELNWGYNDSSRPLKLEEVDRTLDELKGLFDRYAIRSTWATVGGLVEPSANKVDDLLRRPQWIRQNLLNDPKVELGSHTYSHLFLQESKMEEAEGDFEKMAALSAYGFLPKTIVFPRNQYNAETIALAKRYGITTYRGVRRSWYEQSSKFTKESVPSMLAKRAQELLPRHRPVELRCVDGMTEISDSRFFRFFPDSPSGNALNQLYRRILQHELTLAAKQQAFYHIWFHPHNLVVKPYRLEELELFFQHFHVLRERYGMESLHMGDLADRLGC